MVGWMPASVFSYSRVVSGWKVGSPGKLDCLDVYVAANTVHTVFMMETEIGYALRKLL